MRKGLGRRWRNMPRVRSQRRAPPEGTGSTHTDALGRSSPECSKVNIQVPLAYRKPIPMTEHMSMLPGAGVERDGRGQLPTDDPAFPHLFEPDPPYKSSLPTRIARIEKRNQTWSRNAREGSRYVTARSSASTPERRVSPGLRWARISWSTAVVVSSMLECLVRQWRGELDGI